MAEGTPVCGGVSKVSSHADHNAIVEKLKEHIHKLEESQWEIDEVYTTEQQIVGGVKYYYNGKFRNKKDGSLYNARIWLYERAWENFVQVEIETKELIE